MASRRNSLVRRTIEESRPKAERLVDVDTMEHTDAREVGAEWICLQAIRELEIDRFLEKEGWSEIQINTALAQLITRTVYRPSELRSLDIMRQNSAVCELLAGSQGWLAGFSFQGGSMKTTGEGPKDMPEARLYMGHFAIGGGYGYNLVARQWLFHLSLLPTLAVYTGDNITLNGVRQYADTKFPTVILNSRAAIVRNIGERHFVGVTAVSNHLLKNTHGTDLRQSKWRVRAFYGIRF